MCIVTQEIQNLPIQGVVSICSPHLHTIPNMRNPQDVIGKATFSTSSVTRSIYLQGRRTLRGVLRHLHRVAAPTEDGAVVVDVGHSDLHRDSGAQRGAASVRRHHLQGVLSPALPVQPP